MHSPYIGAYWPSRRESKEHCAQRVAQFLTRIELYPEMLRWYKKGKSVKSATKTQVTKTNEGIIGLLKTHNRDTDGSVNEELGFSLGLWNGDTVSLSITCGAFSPFVGNCVVLSFPAVSEIGEEQLTVLRAQTEIVIDVWEPDNAVITSPQLIAANGGGMPWQTRGWLNYRKGESILGNEKSAAR